ncbi:MAG TPA: hypothetical protein DEA08_23230, partial [Planctomycetes bacterium]|nr:hypothetical protein [Planctomycetota bacterium]
IETPTPASVRDPEPSRRELAPPGEEATPGQRDPVEPAAEAPPSPAPSLRGEPLRAALLEILSAGQRAEDAEDQRAAMKAGEALLETLRGVAARGEAEALSEARSWLKPGSPLPLQVSAVRLIDQLEGKAALQLLAELSFGPGRDAALRMHALRALRRRDAPFAQGAITDVVEDRAREDAVRCFAMDQLDPEAAGTLEDVVRDPEDKTDVRRYALEVLKRVDPPRYDRLRGIDLGED